MFEVNLIESWNPNNGFGEPTWHKEFELFEEAFTLGASVLEKGENDWHVEILEQDNGETIVGMTRVSPGVVVVDSYRGQE